MAIIEVYKKTWSQKIQMTEKKNSTAVSITILDFNNTDLSNQNSMELESKQIHQQNTGGRPR